MNRPYTKLASSAVMSLLMACSISAAMAADFPSVDTSTSGINPKAAKMYNLGIQSYKEGSMEAAIIFFRRACDIDPNLTHAQYNLAVIYQSQRRWKDAVPRYEEVLKTKPDDMDAHYQLGTILQELGRYQDARQHFSTIPPNNPHFGEAQRRIAQLNQLQQASATGQPMVQTSVSATTYGGQPTTSVQPLMNELGGSSPSAGTAQDSYGQQPQQPPAQTQPAAGLTAIYGGNSNNLQAPYNPGNGYAASGNGYASTGSSSSPANQLPVGSTQLPAAGQPSTSISALPGISPGGPNPLPAIPNASLRVVATGFNAVAGLAFDKSGNLYVGNFMSNTIDRIAADGTRAQFSSGSLLRGPIGLITDDNGSLYVANYNGGTVVRINPAGVSTVVATGFKRPYYLALDRDGNLYVSQQEDNSIVRITLPKAAALNNH